MPLAIFDLDETLIAEDSDHAWGVYVAEHGLVDPIEHQRRNDEFYAQYKAGQLDINAYLAFACSVLAAHPINLLQEHRAKFVDECIRPVVLSAGQALVDAHKANGDTVLIITSTIEFVTRPIADLFGIKTLIAPTPQISDNRYTGNIVGVPSFGPGKVTRLQAWLGETGESMDGAYFYSDSHNDLPLLRLVDHPIAVDPDPLLRAEAEAQQWKILSLR